MGQTYFAIQTYRQEVADHFNELDEDRRRLVVRGDIKQWNQMLAENAHNVGIITNEEFAIFQNAGYMGLYGGLDVDDIHKRKNLEVGQKILDYMGSTELIANLFRISQTEEKLSEGLIGSGKKKAPSGTSCWSYNGKELAYAPYKTRKFDILKMFIKEKEMHIITFNRDKDIIPDSIIPVEKIKAPILILSSKNDSVWPSYESGIYIEKRLEESRFPYEYKHVAYEYMSHALLTRLPILYKMAFKSERANSKACAVDKENMKKELLDWVNRVWK